MGGVGITEQMATARQRRPSCVTFVQKYQWVITPTVKTPVWPSVHMLSQADAFRTDRFHFPHAQTADQTQHSTPERKMMAREVSLSCVSVNTLIRKHVSMHLPRFSVITEGTIVAKEAVSSSISVCVSGVEKGSSR